MAEVERISEASGSTAMGVPAKLLRERGGSIIIFILSFGEACPVNTMFFTSTSLLRETSTLQSR
jgi:hypothetical protein